MKIPKQSRKSAGKKNTPKIKYVPDHFDEEILSDDLPSDEEEFPHKQESPVDYKTPEQVKIELAKKLIKKTKAAFTKK